MRFSNPRACHAGKKEIPICVLVHNNPLLERTVTSILNQQTAPYSKRIIIGANGCTDSTQDAAIALVKKYPEVELISTPEKGKVVSWNMAMSCLREENGVKIAVFTDSDIFFKEQDTVLSLYKRLSEDERCLAVSASIVPDKRSEPTLEEKHVERFVLTSEKVKARQNAVHGRCYAIRTDLPFLQMIPKDAVLDDSYLTSMIRKFCGSGAIACSDKKAYFRTEGTFKDLFQRMKRITLLQRDFKRNFGFPTSYYNTYRWDLNLLKDMNAGDIPYLLLGVPFLALKCYYSHCHKRVTEKIWKTVSSAQLY